MSSNALYGLLAWALLVGTLATYLPRSRRLPIAFGVAGLALTPLFAGESLAMALHGAFAAPSLTLLQLALRRLAVPHGPALLERPAALVVLGCGLVFYPLALGLGPLDPYGLGYQPLPLLLGLMPLAAWLAWRRQQGWLLVLGIDLLGYAAGLFGNLWDTLLDPILVLLAAAALLSRSRPGR